MSSGEDPDSELEPASEVSVEINTHSPEASMDSSRTTLDSLETTAIDDHVMVPVVCTVFSQTFEIKLNLIIYDNFYFHIKGLFRYDVISWSTCQPG